MSCPLFVDLTRECAKSYPEIINISNYDICNSESYDRFCPLYMILTEGKKPCNFFQKCFKQFIKKEDYLLSIRPDGHILFREKELKMFCFNEQNRKNCKIYQLYDKDNDDIPLDLIPSGYLNELIPQIKK